MNDQQRREAIAALSERVQKRIQLAERCRNATSAAFRGHLAEIAGLTRHLVQAVGLAADVQRDFDGAARSVLQGMTATDAPAPPLNSGKLRWCVVVEELQGAKARCARMSRNSSSSGGGAAGAAGRLNQHDPLFAGQPDVGAARDWEALLIRDSDLQRTVQEHAFAAVHFLVDANSLLHEEARLRRLRRGGEHAGSAESSLEKLLSPLLAFGLDGKAAVALLGGAPVAGADAAPRGDREVRGVSSAAAVCDAMSLLWRGRPSGSIPPASKTHEEDDAADDEDDEEGHSGGGGDDSSRLDLDKLFDLNSSFAVTPASSHAVLHGGGGGAASMSSAATPAGSDASSAAAAAAASSSSSLLFASPKWLQVECVLLMRDGGLFRHAQLSRALAPNSLLSRSRGLLDAEQPHSWRERNLESILSLAPALQMRRAAQQQQQQALSQNDHEQPQHQSDPITHPAMVALRPPHAQQLEVPTERCIKIRFIGSPGVAAVSEMLARLTN